MGAKCHRGMIPMVDIYQCAGYLPTTAVVRFHRHLLPAGTRSFRRGFTTHMPCLAISILSLLTTSSRLRGLYRIHSPAQCSGCSRFSPLIHKPVSVHIYLLGNLSPSLRVAPPTRQTRQLHLMEDLLAESLHVQWRIKASQ